MTQDPDQKRVEKLMRLSVTGGVDPEQLRQRLGIDPDEARQLLENFLEKYPKLARRFRHQTTDQVLDQVIEMDTEQERIVFSETWPQGSHNSKTFLKTKAEFEQAFGAEQDLDASPYLWFQQFPKRAEKTPEEKREIILKVRRDAQDCLDNLPQVPDPSLWRSFLEGFLHVFSLGTHGPSPEEIALERANRIALESTIRMCNQLLETLDD